MEQEIKVLKLEMITLKEDFENVMTNELIMGSLANETQELESENNDDDKIQETRLIIPETLELENEINDVNKK